MRNYFVLLCALLSWGETATAQTVKVLGYATNGEVTYGATNTLTFTNAVTFRTNVTLTNGSLIAAPSSLGNLETNTTYNDMRGLQFRNIGGVVSGAWYARYPGAATVAFAMGQPAKDLVILQPNLVTFETNVFVKGALTFEAFDPGLAQYNDYAGQTRTNLSLGATWLTNTSRQEFQADIFTTNKAIYAGALGGTFFAAVAKWSSGSFVLSMPLDVTDPAGPDLPSYKAVTRTNLGLGATWLTNNNVANFRSAIGLGPTNYVAFGGVEIVGGDEMQFNGTSIASVSYGGVLDFETQNLRQNSSDIFGWNTNMFSVTPPATFVTNVTVNGTLFAANLALSSSTFTNPVTFTTNVTITGGVIEAAPSSLGNLETNTTYNDLRGLQFRNIGGATSAAWYARYPGAATVAFAMGQPAKDLVILQPSLITLATNVFVKGALSFEEFNPGLNQFNDYVGQTRTNLGIGASWVTNAASPLFWVGVPTATNSSGTAGQVAYTNNFLYICIGTDQWRRIQLGTW